MHKSSNVYIVINLRNGNIYQRCFSHKYNCNKWKYYVGNTCNYNHNNVSNQRPVINDWSVGMHESFDIQHIIDKTMTTIEFTKNIVPYINKWHTIIDMPRCIIKKRKVRDTKALPHPAAYQYDTTSISDFIEINSPYVVYIQDDPTIDAIAQQVMRLWLNNVNRLMFEQTVFYPGPVSQSKSVVSSRCFNLFTGFNVLESDLPTRTSEEIEELVKPITDHLYYEWCQQDNELYDYVLNYFASCVWKPEKKIGTCLVIRGAQGSGKGIIMMLLRDIIGQTFKIANNFNDIIGRFNASMMEVTTLFLDEALWGGNKESAGRLKTLITEEYHRIEQKGKDKRDVRSYVNLIIASNNDWVVDHEIGQRRFVQLETSDTFAGGKHPEYFSKLLSVKPLDFAHFLYLRDISTWLPSIIPRTKAESTQIIESLPPIASFWYSCLINECITCGKGDYQDIIWRDYGLKIDKSVLYKAYTFWNETNHKHLEKPAKFWKCMRQFNNNNEFTVTRIRNDTGGRDRFISFPILSDCREMFSSYTKCDFLPYD